MMLPSLAPISQSHDRFVFFPFANLSAWPCAAFKLTMRAVLTVWAATLSRATLSRATLSRATLSRATVFAFWATAFARLACAAPGFPAQSPQDDHFESKVRPLLLAKCVSCHGSEVQESNLRLDTRDHLLRGGENGATVDVQAPEQSLLLEVISYQGDIQMPPDGKLSADQIADLRQWVEAGSPWPASATMGNPMDARIADAKNQHWSFRPIGKPPIPSIPDTPEPENPIDAFIHFKLHSQQLTASPTADNRTLIRRLYFDLLGLPPSPAAVAAFAETSDTVAEADDTAESVSAAGDRSADTHWAALVDELLARPEYGQRWARHWLDVARYADSQGYAFDRDRRYPHAYTYRDYVVEALNNDLPYDQFVLQQLAADQLELGDDLRPLAALGFITVGRRFLDFNDTLDDRIDVVTRGLLGLTVACARCHDHKYDAIPAADYYSLYGVFSSSEEPEVKPVIGQRAEVEARQTYEARERELIRERDEFRKRQVELQKDFTTQRLSDYFFAMIDPNNTMNLDQTDQRVALQADDLRPRMVRRWKDRFAHFAAENNENTAVFRPFAHLIALPDAGFAQHSKNQIEIWHRILHPAENSPAAGEIPGDAPAISQADATNTEPKIEFNQERIEASMVARLREQNFQNKRDVTDFYAQVCLEVWSTFRQHGSSDEAVLQVEKPLRPLIELWRGDSPLNVPAGEIALFLADADFNEHTALENAVADHQKSAPPELPRAMTVHDRSEMREPYVFLRGSEHNHGPAVPRRFLAVLSPEPRENYPSTASGRLQLAQQIVSPDNPLTARVIANRVWMHHFGSPLVDTPSDFGARCEQPVHHELLDFLASYLQENQWSLKALHRLILTSQTYRQASWDRNDGHLIDPENRLYWRMNRRRLEWEPLRDSLLAVAGQLDASLGGPAVDMFRSQASNRRSLYGTIDRQDLPNLLRSFDFASPDSSAAIRPKTTVPQQSLYMMNGDLVSQMATKIGEQPELAELIDSQEKIQWLFQRIYQRNANPEEQAACVRFIEQAPSPPISTDSSTANSSQNDPAGAIVAEKISADKRWASLIQAMLMSNEFCFFD